MSGVVRWAVKTMLKRRDRLTARLVLSAGKNERDGVFLSPLKTPFYNAARAAIPLCLPNTVHRARNFFSNIPPLYLR